MGLIGTVVDEMKTLQNKANDEEKDKDAKKKNGNVYFLSFPPNQMMSFPYFGCIMLIFSSDTQKRLE